LADNGSASVQYKWQRNGQSVGNNNPRYIHNNAKNGDRISCELSTSDACFTEPIAVSNEIVIDIHPLPQPVLDRNNKLCAGSYRVLDAGPYVSFLWSDGSVGRQYQLKNPDNIFVEVTDQYGCKGSDTTFVNQIVAVPSGFLPADTAKCSYGFLELNATASYKKYQWSDFSERPALQV
jgi:hypothetical protein